MQRIVNLIRSQLDFLFLLPLIAFSLSTRLREYGRLLESPKGFPTSPDAKWYLEYARKFLETGKIGAEMNDIMYLGYNMLLSLLLALFGDPKAVVLVQAIVTGVCVVFVYGIAKTLFNRSTAVIASIFYSLSWPLTMWSMYVLSDSFFISLLLFNVYTLVRFFATRKRLFGVLFLASAFYMLIFRPTGVISLFFIFVYILLQFDKLTLRDFLRKRWRLLTAAAGTAVAVGIVLLTAGKLDPLIASMKENIRNVLYRIYAVGWIYDHKSPQDYIYKPDKSITVLNSLILSFIINNWDHLLVLYGKRCIAFLGKWVWKTDTSTFQGIVTLLQNLIPTFLFLIGTIAAIVNKVFRRAAVLWLIILAVFLFCVIFFIDGLYRYKAPSLPFFAIVCAYGIDSILRAVIGGANTYTGKLLRWYKEKR